MHARAMLMPRLVLFSMATPTVAFHHSRTMPAMVRAPSPLMSDLFSESGARAANDAAKAERLKQLFGEQAAEKIAQRTNVPTKNSASFEPPVEEEFDIKRLMNGPQILEWGAIRMIDVDMAPDGMLECSLEPLLEAGLSTLLCVRVEMPLGMLLEEDFAAGAEGDKQLALFVGELLEDSAAQTAGVCEGDLLRATTGMRMGMAYPTWQLLMGGVGKPTLQKVLLPTLGQPFETVMAAIGSNSVQQQGNGQVILLLERPNDAPAESSDAAVA